MLLQLLAQTYDYTTPTTPGGSSTGLGIFSGVWLLFWLAFLVLSLIAMWRIFTKAGKPGWASIIPFYNMYVLLQIAGRPGWWLILFFIPIVNFILTIIVGVDVAKRFGYGAAFGAIVCGLLGIGYLIIGFSSAQYQGNGAAPTSFENPSQTPSAPTQTPPTGNFPPQA